jgi:hypothetical protein
MRICLISASAAQSAHANSAGSRRTKRGRNSAIAARIAGTRAPELSRVNTSPITMSPASSWRIAIARPMIAPTSAGSAVPPERNSHRAAAGPRPGGPTTSTSCPVSIRCSIQGTIGEKWPAPAVDAQMTRMYTSCRFTDLGLGHDRQVWWPWDEVLLARHGQTEWKLQQRRRQGQLDSPLTPSGADQVGRYASALADRGVDEIFSSPLRAACAPRPPSVITSVCRSR